MKFRRIAVVGLAFATLASCHSDDVASPLTVAQLCARKDSLLLASPGATIDDHFEILARLLPGGFGGLTIGFMFLKEPALVDTLRATAKNLLTCSGTLPPYLEAVQLVSVRRGDFDWIELHAWYRTLIERVPATWNRADIDEGINRLSFAFDGQADLDLFRSRAISAGVPAAALFLFVAPIARGEVSPPSI